MSFYSSGKSHPPTNEGSGYEKKNHFSDSLSEKSKGRHQ